MATNRFQKPPLLRIVSCFAPIAEKLVTRNRLVGQGILEAKAIMAMAAEAMEAEAMEDLFFATGNGNRWSKHHHLLQTGLLFRLSTCAIRKQDKDMEEERFSHMAVKMFKLTPLQSLQW